MKFITRFSKFPYIFWSFGKAYECQLKDDLIICNNKTYEYKKFSKLYFLTLKYLPIALIFYFIITKYDFSFEIVKIITYLLSMLIFLSFFYLENLFRFISLAILFTFSLVIGFYLESYSLIAYVIKYAIILLSIFMFFVDIKFNCYELILNKKVVSHFLIKDKI